MMLFTKRCLTGLFAVLSLSLLAFSAPVFAVASLQVIVTDAQRNELPGEKISLFTEDGQQIRVDDKRGAVTYFNDLPPGSYVLKSGDQTLRTVNISLTDTAKRISVIRRAGGGLSVESDAQLNTTASATASGPAASPALMAAGMGAGVGAMAALGAVLNTDDGGSGESGDEQPLTNTAGGGSGEAGGTGNYGSYYSMSSALSEASDLVSGLMTRSGLESSANGYVPPAFSPHTGLPVQNRRGLTPMASGSAFWLRAFGNRFRAQAGLRPEAGHLGLAAGYDLRLNATRFGVLVGYYGQRELRFEGPQRFRPGPSLFKDPFAGIYVRRDFAPFSVQVGLSGGTLRHASSRLVNGNLAPNGLAQAEARTRSWWLAPEARVGLRLDTGLMEFEPSFTARYARQSIQGFSEMGGRAPATVGQRKVELLETRLELKASREMGPGRIALRLGWKYRDDLNSSQARLLGESQRARLGFGSGSSFYLGAETEFELTPGLFLNLSSEAISGNGYRNMSGMASVYQAF